MRSSVPTIVGPWYSFFLGRAIVLILQRVQDVRDVFGAGRLDVHLALEAMVLLQERGANLGVDCFVEHTIHEVVLAGEYCVLQDARQWAIRRVGDDCFGVPADMLRKVWDGEVAALGG